MYPMNIEMTHLFKKLIMEELIYRRYLVDADFTTQAFFNLQ